MTSEIKEELEEIKEETAVEETVETAEEGTKEVAVEEKVEETPKKEIKAKESPKKVNKYDVIAIIDKVIAQSTRLLAGFTVRSAEARAMLNGIKDEVSKL